LKEKTLAPTGTSDAGRNGSGSRKGEVRVYAKKKSRTALGRKNAKNEEEKDRDMLIFARKKDKENQKETVECENENRRNPSIGQTSRWEGQLTAWHRRGTRKNLEAGKKLGNSTLKRTINDHRA